MGFQGDRRGVSNVIGAVFVFGLIIMLLSMYQAYGVPSENKQVEFEHYQDIQGDMKEVRRVIIDVGQTNNERSTTLKLGTQYPPRFFTINAPPPTGNLQTDTIGPGQITLGGANLTAICGLENTTTKELTYTPNYHYIDGTPSITYENTVIYRNTTDGNVLIDSGQTVISGNSINIFPLLGNISESHYGTVDVDIQGDESGTTDVSKKLRLTLPSRISAATWETELLADEPVVKNVTTNTTQESAVDINLNAAVYDIRCTPVGSGEQPDVTITQGETANEINPGAPGDIALQDEGRGNANQGYIIHLRLNNTAELDLQINQARLNFYQDSSIQGGAPKYANLTNGPGEATATLGFRKNFQSLQPTINLEGNGTVTEIDLEFYAEDGSTAGIAESDWFVISFRFSESKSATYFVPIPKKGT